MFSKLMKIFLADEIEKLSEENKKLKLKLSEKQQQINKTNSYYKKKLHRVTK